MGPYSSGKSAISAFLGGLVPRDALRGRIPVCFFALFLFAKSLAVFFLFFFRFLSGVLAARRVRAKHQYVFLF